MVPNELDHEEVRAAVREQYGRIARVAASGPGCCAPAREVAAPAPAAAVASCCGPVKPVASTALGYAASELEALPDEAESASAAATRRPSRRWHPARSCSIWARARASTASSRRARSARPGASSVST